MAKISKTLMKLEKSLEKHKGLFFKHSQLKKDNEKLIQFISIFDSVTDDRIKNMCTYPTQTIVSLVFLGLLDEENTWKGIYNFANDRKEFLSNYIDLSNGIPSEDTLVRVFSLLDSDSLEAVLVNFLQTCITTTAKALKVEDEGIHLVSMDGKEENGSGRKYHTDEKVKNAQIMHFYDYSTGVCIKSALIDDKTNEIPVAQAVLSSLHIKDFIITSDAMNCQVNTVNVIREKKAHYVLGLKKNHSSFFAEVEEKFNKKTKYSSKDYYKMETEKNHNQVEIREFYRINPNDCFFEEKWRDLKSIVLYKKTMNDNFTGKDKIEKRYYISDMKDTTLIAQSIRTHWSVENQLHWHLDVNFNEDANSTMNKRALCNLSILNKTVLTIMKLLRPLFGKDRSIKSVQRGFRRNYENNIITLFQFLNSDNLDCLFNKK